MAKTCRIDRALVANPDGSIELHYTAGMAPLRNDVAGTSFTYASKADLLEAVRRLDEKLTDEDRALIALVSYSKSSGDTNLTKTAAQGLVGKVVSTDFSVGGASAIQIS